MPQVGGAQDAVSPAPPGDCAVTVVPTNVATVELSVKIVTGAGETTTPFSSIMSTCTCLVSLTFMVLEKVKPLAGSPAPCKINCAGMQVLKKTAGEVVVPTLATTPEIPGTLAVAKPFASMVTTAPADGAQVIFPTVDVISV